MRMGSEAALTRWKVITLPDGEYEVRREGRRVATARDIMAALTKVRDSGWSPGDRVVLVEEDGYERTLSRSFERGTEKRSNYP